ncbi:MAG: KEOPS complex kinase/ATPase Bud32 [Nanoarchaeota archaeon]
MNYKIIARGAEAIIIKEKNKIIKQRIPKGYRYPTLDNKLRSQRTRAEARLLEKARALIPAPKLIATNEITKTIELEYINGKKLADNLEKLKDYQAVCVQIGKHVAKLHDANIIHGDLTTSNMIYNEKSKKVYFIDFGLGFHSQRAEDKAVDLHVLKEALQARHPKLAEKAWKEIIRGYKKSQNYSQTLKQLERVERRGRYKPHY